MASVENSDYVKLVKTIKAMEALVAEADAGRRLMLYGEQCKELVDEFKYMRKSMSIGPGGESTPILRELFRMACDAKTVLESCSCEDQTSWLQSALIQNDRTIFKSILDDLKRGFDIFLQGGNSSTLRPRCYRDRVSLFNKDRDHLGEELQRLIKEDNNTVPELDKSIATFLHARFTNEKEWKFFAERAVSGEPWDPNELDNNALGEPGSFGVVQATRWFGIKLARKRFFSGMSQECLDEITTMAMLNHHNVVRFVSSSRDKKRPAIIMECMEMTLTEYLQKRGRHNFEGQGAGWLIRPTDGKAPFGAAPDQIMIAVDIMYQIASGMEYLHGEPHKVAHLDLKPSNILINKCKEDFKRCVHVKIEEDSNGDIHVKIEEDFTGYVHVKIADMGLSKTGIEDDDLRRNSKANRGTTLYRAPEMYREGKFVCPKKADVYAFGVICWEILHGKEPLLEDVKVSEYYGPVVKRGVRPVIDPTLCPDYLEKLIRECWHRDPNRRPSFSTCSLALQSYKAMALGSGKESLLDFRVPTETLENRIRRLCRILILHVRQLRH